MISFSAFRKFILGAAIVAVPAASYAGVFVSVNIAPPVLPVYTQPLCPGDGYLWTPGYWAYGDAGYYWVPGVWVQPPSVGVLWTPGYWGFVGGAYRWNAGYWGPHVGFYGGVNYGFGFGGVGFEGGYWNGGHFFYNQRVANINVNVIHNTYVRNVTVVNNNYAHTSFNGGPNGVPAHATPGEMQAMHEQHFQPTASQEQFRQQAASNRSQLASVNGGHPSTLAAQTPRDGFGHGNEVNARQGNQQARINQGVRSGQMTPGETRNVENRDASINRQAQADRAANGGRLTGQEKQQINQRQNNVSQSIAADKHNANNDAAAAARNGRTAGSERRQAGRVEEKDRPKR
ncbi:YXWGXW repeat-containing protein [Granulicella rosea]|uniref:YXWGXW repeat-containing protein n=1 Tax=Granulicella rosea TaxID=474952 RepID=A0A239D6H7_9BACT|nr:YXWGXW repeat-containing protein [Granulicella rosea]SNS27618.1 YXWGXW repeat-containing protein [Granulicella rosea]